MRRLAAFSARRFLIANWFQEYRFHALYAKTDSETENKKSSGKALQNNGNRQSVARPRWPSTLAGVQERKAQTPSCEARGAGFN